MMREHFYFQLWQTERAARQQIEAEVARLRRLLAHIELGLAIHEAEGIEPSRALEPTTAISRR